MSDFFTPIANTKPYFKAAFEGFAGSGKTYTAALVARGLHKRIGSTKPVVIFDTEKAAKFLTPLFAEAGIQVLVRESRSLADLKEAMRQLREAKVSDILIIDSISHIWENVLESYKQKVKRNGLQFQDWGIIKPMWKTEFSDPFVNDPYHIVMCGRAGYEYENEVNQDTGKREIYKSGIKMKVEGETAYEPDLLVLMERFQEMDGGTIKKVVRTANIIKDRSTVLDGKVFENPTYENFAPVVEVMLSNPYDKKVLRVPEADTGLLFRTEEEKMEWKRTRDILVERLENLLKKIYPGATGKDAQAKIELLDFVFGTSSMTEITQMRPEPLSIGIKQLCDHLVEMGVAEYATSTAGQKVIVKKQEDEKKAVVEENKIGNVEKGKHLKVPRVPDVKK